MPLKLRIQENVKITFSVRHIYEAVFSSLSQSQNHTPKDGPKMKTKVTSHNKKNYETKHCVYSNH